MRPVADELDPADNRARHIICDMTTTRVRGLATRITWLWVRRPSTYKQAWLGAASMLLPLFGILYGIAALTHLLFGLRSLSLIVIAICAVYGCLVAALGSCRRIRRATSVPDQAGSRKQSRSLTN